MKKAAFPHRRCVEIAVALCIVCLIACGGIALSADSSPEIVHVIIQQASTAKDYQACLEKCNEMKLITGFEFRWTLTNSTTAQKLKGKDVVMYPGGANMSKVTDIPALQAFVRNGGGYYGTCAGEYTLIKDFGLASNLESEATHFIGPVNMRMTDWGARVFGYGGDQMLKHYNGYGVYAKSREVSVPFAHYKQNHEGTVRRAGGSNVAETGYWKVHLDTAGNGEKYMGAFGEYYGKGRAVGVGPHPEIGGRSGYYWYPKWVGAGVLWAAGYDNALRSYILGYDQGFYTDASFRTLEAGAEYSMICQREYVSSSGMISSIRVLTGGGDGKVLGGIYVGADRPEKCVVQTVVANAQDSRGWQELTLQRPRRVTRGDSVWLAFLFEDPQQQYYYKRFSDKENEAFENRVWTSTTKPGDIEGGLLPDSPPGSIKDYLVCMFTEVVFDTSDPDYDILPVSVLTPD